jgi:regulatory protein
MKKKLRKIPTEQNLANVALHYLQRYAASEASLRRVLANRLRRAGMDHPDFARDENRMRALHSAIETIIARHKKSGAVNDAAFAETKIHSLRRQGKSARAIQQKLALKGIKSEMVKDALAQHADGQEMEAVEFRAALALARKRRWGPYRKTDVADPEKLREKTHKEFAGLARAGFSSAIAKRVLNCDAPEEWE